MPAPQEEFCISSPDHYSSSVFNRMWTRPTKDNIKTLIVRDFEARHYRVTDLQISDIKPSTGEKIYMGSKSYIVHIPLITFEATQDTGSPVLYMKGQKFGFKNASVEIKEDLYKKGKWTIKDIKGIPVP
jgi:hypothetical protein